MASPTPPCPHFRETNPLFNTLLEEQYGAEAHTHSSDLAYHFAEAEPVLGSEELVQYSLVAENNR